MSQWNNGEETDNWRRERERQKERGREKNNNKTSGSEGKKKKKKRRLMVRERLRREGRRRRKRGIERKWGICTSRKGENMEQSSEKSKKSSRNRI